MRAVYGNQQAQARLERAVLGDAVSHAWLLTGSAGIGKTTLALEFARLLQCTGRDPVSGEPCGVCASCRKISSRQPSRCHGHHAKEGRAHAQNRTRARHDTAGEPHAIRGSLAHLRDS